VTAAFAAAAALKTEFTVPGLSQTLIFTRISGRTPVPEKESLLSLADHKASMAIYLSSGMAEAVAESLSKAYGPCAPCVIAFKVSHPDQKMIQTTVDKLVKIMAEHHINRHALIIAGPFLEAGGNARSLLYHKQFSHGYREET
jgi:precorrin-4/cobalt-precorrin-4 C11-methyltransferase